MHSNEEKVAVQRSFSEIISDYYQLTKPGITFAVLISMLVGFVVGSAGSIDFITMLHALIGTYLIAAGTGAHNQFMERNLDGLMKRTESRPLPAQRVPAQKGAVFSLTLLFSGLTYLVLMVNMVAGLVSFATALIYLAAYTPLKRVSAFNIMVGAIPGALPPVGGWAAASGTITEPGMWLFFGILFLWQIPHVMAIAWMYKDDYSGAGFKMLPKNDTAGKKTAFYAILCTLLLFPLSYFIYEFGVSGITFLVLSTLLAIMFLVYSIRFARDRTRLNARKLMFASIIYLPMVWVAVFIDTLF
ncbi:MAG: protoheme IX farnesyltransferase [Balneola sp.]|nr:MAG: protoheme IX farnesyltransferase [Balneola sp.]